MEQQITEYDRPGYLHTYPEKYFHPTTNWSTDSGAFGKSFIGQRITNLKKKERSFYQAIFGVNTYSAFIKKLRQTFPKDSDDNKAFQCFTAENIENSLLKLANQQMGSFSNITVTFQIVNGATIPIEMQSYLNNSANSSRVINGNTIKLNAGFNLQELKQVFNAIDKNRRYREKSSNISNAEQFLSELIAGNTSYSNWITVSTSSQSNSQNFSGLLKFRPEPWGYTEKTIKEGILKNSPAIIKARDDAKTAINNIAAGLNTSANFKNALKITTNKYFSEVDYYAEFFGGAAFSNKLKGALGEFQTVLLGEYLNLCVGQLSGKLVTKINNQRNNGELPNTDTIWKIGEKEFGFQVKNYGSFITKESELTNFYHDIEIKQHPSNLSGYFGGNATYSDIDKNIQYFLANYFFQKNNQATYAQQYNDLETFFKKNLAAEALRLASSSIPDANVFFNVGSKFLIPGSEILTMYFQNNDTYSIEKEAEKAKLEISGPQPITSAAHSSGEYTKKNSEGKISAYTYWVNGKQQTWMPTEYNVSQYASYITSQISIRARLEPLTLSKKFSYL